MGRWPTGGRAWRSSRRDPASVRRRTDGPVTRIARRTAAERSPGVTAYRAVGILPPRAVGPRPKGAAAAVASGASPIRGVPGVAHRGGIAPSVNDALAAAELRARKFLASHR